MHYTSDSGMSEAGPSSGPVSRGVTKRQRGEMRASQDLYTETRPSMLSADRIGFTQHSGAPQGQQLSCAFHPFQQSSVKSSALVYGTTWVPKACIGTA